MKSVTLCQYANGINICIRVLRFTNQQNMNYSFYALTRSCNHKGGWLGSLGSMYQGETPFENPVPPPPTPTSPLVTGALN